MTLLELLAAIRRPYAEALSGAVVEVCAHVEPAFRDQNGELATEGSLALPCRADYIPHEGDGKPKMVDSTSRLNFEAVELDYGDCIVRIGPFAWDWVRVTIGGLSEPEVAAASREWFLRWFDPQDTNEINDQGLYGVVHFLGDPKVVSDGIELTIDLGSAPPEALDDFFAQISKRGASVASVA